MVVSCANTGDVRQHRCTADSLVVIGSSSFWHAGSDETCRRIGRNLATLNSLSVITGGMEGAG